MQTEANEKEVEEALAKIRPDEAAMGSKKVLCFQGLPSPLMCGRS